MPSPSQDTVACTCPSCGNPFAVKTSFLGSQVQCPICAAPVTAWQEEKVKDETEEQAAVPCRCNVCNNSFAVNPSCIGNKVKCPVCHSTRHGHPAGGRSQQRPRNGCLKLRKSA